MRVIHYIPSIDRESGGVGSYMQLMAKSLGELVELHVVTHASDHELMLENCQLYYMAHCTSYVKMKKQWNTLLNDIDPHVVHINSCWQPESAFVQKWASNMGYKTVYTPHGMLEPWILHRHYWTRKVPALLLYQKASIKGADVIHATSECERQNLLSLGYNKNVVVIPNGIDVRQIEVKDGWEKKRTLLFLSRIHVKKGIELLIYAVAALKEEMNGYQVLIAGEGDADYIAELKDLAQKKGVNDMVQFIGGVYGDAKWELYRKADVFVLPTHSENFGIVVAEALASGTPVITTTGTPWCELNTKQCGWWVPCSQDEITNAVHSAIKSTDVELKIMGQKGRQLIEERYSVESVAMRMKSLYECLV